MDVILGGRFGSCCNAILPSVMVVMVMVMLTLMLTLGALLEASWRSFWRPLGGRFGSLLEVSWSSLGGQIGAILELSGARFGGLPEVDFELVEVSRCQSGVVMLIELFIRLV